MHYVVFFMASNNALVDIQYFMVSNNALFDIMHCFIQCIVSDNSWFQTQVTGLSDLK